MTLFPCWTSLSLPGASDLGSGEESSRLMIVLHPKPGIGWGSPWQQILVLALEQWTSFFPLSDVWGAYLLSLTWQLSRLLQHRERIGLERSINSPSQERLVTCVQWVVLSDGASNRVSAEHWGGAEASWFWSWQAGSGFPWCSCDPGFSETCRLNQL